MQRPAWYKSSKYFRTLWSVACIPISLILSMAQGDTSEARYKDLGHRLVCMCDSQPASGVGQRGCRQVLLECSHVGCEPSKRMRTELSNALGKGDTDEAILNSFAQTYGADVLEQSSAAVAKLLLALALVALIFLTVVFVRKQKVRPASSAIPLSESDETDSR